MTEANLFQSENDNSQIEFDQNKNYLEELVGDGKKFKSVDDLAKSKAYSDIHIANLERRMDQMREDYIRVKSESESGAKLQELIDLMKTQGTQQQTSSTNTQANDGTQSPVIKPEEIQSLVSNEVAKLEATRREQDNYNQVLAKVTERYGNNYRTVLKDQANALGLTEDDINSMARRNPNLFYKTFDINENRQQSFQTPPTSQTRQSNFTPRAEKRTMSFYEKMRKENPVAYFDPKIAVQMDRDAQALGQDFFDI